jgi:hypothetical protein
MLRIRAVALRAGRHRSPGLFPTPSQYTVVLVERCGAAAPLLCRSRPKWPICVLTLRQRSAIVDNTNLISKKSIKSPDERSEVVCARGFRPITPISCEAIRHFVVVHPQCRAGRQKGPAAAGQTAAHSLTPAPGVPDAPLSRGSAPAQAIIAINSGSSQLTTRHDTARTRWEVQTLSAAVGRRPSELESGVPWTHRRTT